MSGHDLLVVVDHDGTQLHCKCTWDYNDTSRPCWPHDIETREPMPAPQTSCTFVDWIENIGLEVLGEPIRFNAVVTRGWWDLDNLQIAAAPDPARAEE